MIGRRVLPLVVLILPRVRALAEQEKPGLIIVFTYPRPKRFLSLLSHKLVSIAEKGDYLPPEIFDRHSIGNYNRFFEIF